MNVIERLAKYVVAPETVNMHTKQAGEPSFPLPTQGVLGDDEIGSVRTVMAALHEESRLK
jgi:poly(3-hydroxybutyrate) depolymerase